MSKVLLSCIVALCLMSVLLFVNVASAQDDVTTVTVPVRIDGITRTVMVAISGTDVLTVTVAPITDTFRVTATTWMTALYDSVYTDTNITATNDALAHLLTVTQETIYPRHWTPFVRQYRFAIFICRDWVRFRAETSKDNNGAVFAVAPLTTLAVACGEQYQDAYVEMERIAYPVPAPRSKHP